ncbi:MAG: anti-sigma factor [Vicinamibacterales bacterium]
MTCTQFRDLLDAYVDRELASDALAAATAHRSGCPHCDRLAVQALDLKASVRRTVRAVDLPAGLEARVRASIAPRWQPWKLVAAAVLVFGLAAGTIPHNRVERNAANAMDSMALRLDDSSAVVLTGTVLCRDCELEHRYGVEAPCRSIGHHGAIATDDGRIWNLVEQKAAHDLIHDESLLGRRIVVHGRIFRGARALVVERYQLQG